MMARERERERAVVCCSDLSSCTVSRREGRTERERERERETDFTEVESFLARTLCVYMCSSSILQRMFDQSIHSTWHTYTDRKRKKERKEEREILQQRLLSPLLRLLVAQLKWLWCDEPLLAAVTMVDFGGHGKRGKIKKCPGENKAKRVAREEVKWKREREKESGKERK